MRPYASLRRRADFTRIRRRGRRIDGPHLAINAAPSAGAQPRVAILTTKNFPGAVERNRARRRVRAAFDALDLSGPRFDLIIAARPSAGTTDFHNLQAELAAALAKLDA